MNQMKYDRNSWEGIRIQISLCIMKPFFFLFFLAHGQPKLPWLKTFFYFETFAQCFILHVCHLFKDILKSAFMSSFYKHLTIANFQEQSYSIQIMQF